MDFCDSLALREGHVNRDHLGDAYDYWKRAMLDVLRGGGRTLKIIPMITDKKWKETESRIYKSLLGARAHEDVWPDTFERKEGQRYDLFLDPDTGIKRDKSKNHGNKRKKSSNKSEKSSKSRVAAKHLKDSALCDLLSKTNVVAVYQHAPREPKGWLRKKIGELRKAHIKAVGYEAGRVGMIFFTKSKDRLLDIEKNLRDLAGPTAGKRVIRR
jgi:hypothetical protein